MQALRGATIGRCTIFPIRSAAGTARGRPARPSSWPPAPPSRATATTAARLDEIARAAGFSKGAVYSNFANKAELFLAIMDMNIEQSLATGGRVLFEVPSAELTDDSDAARSVRNFALATLEFVAVAARDEVLSAEVARRIDLQVLGYAAVAEAARAAVRPVSGCGGAEDRREQCLRR